MEEHKQPPSLQDLDARLKAVQQRRQPKPASDPVSKGGVSGVGVGIRIAVDLVAGVGVGVGMGVVLDRWLETQPWMLIIFFILGSAAGVMNVVRTANQLDAQAKRAKQDAEAARSEKDAQR
ncbi:AtpZ/AtpI family protein [Aestuariispira ectoiniformans]|uniref:AtpZ/AtpI family protein n=1 Tax=Aestuariispira ectoiniformans TaxID=2775080 RepID=UPI00223B3A00|nr:AtpZ/AtpI family protein [Aestuariispira ectoiniformans]